MIREDDLNFSNDKNNESMTDTLDAGVQSQRLLLISHHKIRIQSKTIPFSLDPDFVLVFAGFARKRHKEAISVSEDPSFCHLTPLIP